ncbi:MAG: hypothetical protein A2Y33_15035 [Spirochaetes bacterium GWF1_51_8]|nr:MAG: hypothetical protein A2Y33_15035 [Spirochaetes bacterium GWF1_51_8]
MNPCPLTKRACLGEKCVFTPEGVIPTASPDGSCDALYGWVRGRFESKVVNIRTSGLSADLLAGIKESYRKAG